MLDYAVSVSCCHSEAGRKTGDQDSLAIPPDVLAAFHMARVLLAIMLLSSCFAFAAAFSPFALHIVMRVPIIWSQRSYK